MICSYDDFKSGKHEWSDFFRRIYDFLQCEDLSFDERLAVMKSIHSHTNGDLESYDLWLYDNLKDNNTTNKSRAYQALRELDNHLWRHGVARARLFCYLNLSVAEYAYLCTDLGWKDSDTIKLYGDLVESANILYSKAVDLREYAEGRGRCGTTLYCHYDVDHKKKYFEICDWANTYPAGGQLNYIILKDELSYEDAIERFNDKYTVVDKKSYEDVMHEFENEISAVITA